MSGTILSKNPLSRFTVAEFIEELESRGFENYHIIDLGPEIWHLEHPLRCRLLQLDEDSNVMRTLRETCVVNQACENGLAGKIKDDYGEGRHIIDQTALEDSALELP